MTIKIGDTIPTVTLKRLGANGMEDVVTTDYFKGKKIVLFATPGAFTPSCAQKHLPGYVNNADAIKSQGVDEIICLSVNDPFVMRHWGESANVNGKVTMLPDGNAQFVEALGLTMDGSGFGLGKRAQRFSMVIENNIVTDLAVEEAASNVELSGAEACMVKLGAK
jgi:peroxiredoxin